MLNLKKVAVTGGVSSGKTTVCRILEDHGAFQVSSDEIIHQLLSLNTICIEQVTNLLGSEIIKDEKIDRRKVAELVFSSEEKLRALEKILHPLLFEEIEKLYQKIKKLNKYSLFVVEMPLVQEIGKQTYFDIIISIISDEKLAKERFQNRGFSPHEYEERMRWQWLPKEKAKKAHFIITNNGSLSELNAEVICLLKKITTNA